MITVKAQTDQGVMTFTKSSDSETRQELISQAIKSLIDTGGVIICQNVENAPWWRYRVEPGVDGATQNNNLVWIDRPKEHPRKPHNFTSCFTL